MEFDNIGKKCNYCNQRDFLPIICLHCKKHFCKEHSFSNFGISTSYKLLNFDIWLSKSLFAISNCSFWAPVISTWAEDEVYNAYLNLLDTEFLAPNPPAITLATASTSSCKSFIFL